MIYWDFAINSKSVFGFIWGKIEKNLKNLAIFSPIKL